MIDIVKLCGNYRHGNCIAGGKCLYFQKNPTGCLYFLKYFLKGLYKFPQEKVDWDYNDHIISIDTETTGLDPLKTCLIEIGAVERVGGIVKEVFQTFICPQRPLSQEEIDLAGAVSKIDIDTIYAAPKLAQVMPNFYNVIKDHVLLFYNAKFDLSFLNSSLLSIGLPELNNKVIDARVMAEWLFPEQPNHLKNLIQHLGLRDVKNTHEAVSDAKAALAAYYAMKDIYKGRFGK